MKNIISDYQSDAVQSVAKSICEGRESVEAKLEAIFLYVRDSIKFGFLPRIDDYRASEIITIGTGQCNNKSSVFLALCKSAGIDARICFSGIRKEIQRGLFKGIAYKFMPREISHSWVEVKAGDNWTRIDSFINDRDFYDSGKRELQKRGWKTGFSISCESGASSSDFDLADNSFVQMDAVTELYGAFDDPSDFFRSENYRNKPGFIKRAMYILALKGINGRVENIRRSSE